MNRRGSLRASDADRDEIVSRLHRAATEGRIASDELEQRVATALKARTYGELEATVADLPAPRQRSRAPARRSPLGWALSTIRAYPVLLVFALPVVTATMAIMLAVTILWAVVTLLVVVLGGRGRAARAPWMYPRHRRPYGPPRRRSYWA
jgi:Flp pilus assembly protein TadB